MIKYDLAGKAAIVTGAASGIGLATATMLARNGCTVAVNFLPAMRGVRRRLANLAPGRAFPIEAAGHVGQSARKKRSRWVIEDTIRKLGRLDLLVNNAGTAGPYRGAVPAGAGSTWSMTNGGDDPATKSFLGVFRCSKGGRVGR